MSGTRDDTDTQLRDTDAHSSDTQLRDTGAHTRDDTGTHSSGTRTYTPRHRHTSGARTRALHSNRTAHQSAKKYDAKIVDSFKNIKGKCFVGPHFKKIFACGAIAGGLPPPRPPACTSLSLQYFYLVFLSV